MSSSKSTRVLHGKAYQLFIEEFSKHLEKYNQFFRTGHKLTKQEISDAQIAFHTIKGGAGFFGLKLIASRAAAIEDLLSNPDFSFDTNKSTVLDMIEALRGASNEISKATFNEPSKGQE